MQPMESLLRELVEMHSMDSARVIERIEPSKATKLVDSLPVDSVSPVFERLPPRFASEILDQLGSHRTNALLSRMAPQNLAALLMHHLIHHHF
jgi:Mg/Co/Ni transporter MgtE